MTSDSMKNLPNQSMTKEPSSLPLLLGAVGAAGAVDQRTGNASAAALQCTCICRDSLGSGVGPHNTVEVRLFCVIVCRQTCG